MVGAAPQSMPPSASAPSAASAPPPTVPIPRWPLDADDPVRDWYENDLGWPTVPAAEAGATPGSPACADAGAGGPLRLLVGPRFDVLDVPAAAGVHALRHLAPCSPVALEGPRMRLLVAPGSARELPGLLDWLEWGSLDLDLTALGEGAVMTAPEPVRGVGARWPARGAAVTAPWTAGEPPVTSAWAEGDLPVPAGGAGRAPGASDGCVGPSGGSVGPSDGCLGPADGCEWPSGGCLRQTDGCLGPAGECEWPSGGCLEPAGECEWPSGGLRRPSGGCQWPPGGSVGPSDGCLEPAGGCERPSGGGLWPPEGRARGLSGGWVRGSSHPGPRVQGAAVWVRPPWPGCEVEASLPTLSALGGGGDAPDLVRVVDTVATHCHRIRLRRGCAQPFAFS